MSELNVALAGVGGFGKTHVEMCETLAAEGLVRVAAFTDPNDATPAASDLRAKGARYYADYEEMLAGEQDLDLVCIAAPIPYHKPIAMAAFKRGLHAYLEKPPAVRIQDLRDMVALQNSNGCFCTVGFQDVARPHVAALKRALCEGAIGTVRAVRAEARWQRTTAYYTRAFWSGKTRIGEDYVLDGPMNNACAHVLNLTAYLAAPEFHEFAVPTAVQGELYRASADTQGEDTDCLRARMDSGVEVCIHLTQSAGGTHPRTWRIIGDDGEAFLHEKDGVDLPGRHVDAAEPELPQVTMLRRLVEVIVGTDEPLLMPLAEAEGFMLLSNGAYESAGGVVQIPREYVTATPVEDSTATVVDGLEDTIVAAVEAGQLLSEHGVPWAVPTEPFDVTKYEAFPARWSA